MSINQLTKSSFAGTIGRFSVIVFMLTCIGSVAAFAQAAGTIRRNPNGMEFAYIPASSLQQGRKRAPRRPGGNNSRTQIYNGYALAVESIERRDSWDDYATKVHLNAPEGDEFIVIHVSANRKGKEDGVMFERFELVGMNGVKGESALKKLGTGEAGGEPWRYSTIVEYENGRKSLVMQREEQGLNVVFTIRKGTRLKTLKLDDLSFDISRVRVTRADE